MTKVKRAILLILLLISSTVLCLSFGGKKTKAETASADKSVCSNEAVEPQGIYTKMSFALNGGDGQVWFTAKNQFTLFSSTVTVQIELYRSDTYQDDFANMTLVAENYIYDLDQGKSLTATASTDGKQSYWRARGYYQRDSSGWKEVVSETILYTADGIRVQ